MTNPKAQRIHFIGACGRGMGGLAVALAKRGDHVTGSDRAVFPPMGDIVRAGGVKVFEGFDRKNLKGPIDHVVIGSVCTRANPEVEETLKRRIPFSSFAAFMGREFLSRKHNIVIAGTNGKSTTTALTILALQKLGKKPDYFLGGASKNFPALARLTGSMWCVLEGDEYISGFCDRNPKFIYYHPRVVVLTSLQHDHPEVYATPESYLALFRDLVQLLPPDGVLIYASEDPLCAEIAAGARCRTISVGMDRKADRPITGVRRAGTGGMRFKLSGVDFQLPVIGLMNVRNAAMALVAAEQAVPGASKPNDIFKEFLPMEGRQEVLFSSRNVVHVRDDGYHPGAIAACVQAVRAAYPRHQLLYALQPRYTGGKYGLAQRELPSALQGVDIAVITPPMDIVKFPDGPFSARRLLAALRKSGIVCHAAKDIKSLPDAVFPRIEGKTVLVSSVSLRNEVYFTAMADQLTAKIGESRGNVPSIA